MNTITVISDILDNQNLESSFVTDLNQMAQEFEFQILMQELAQEINS